jgi:hypothetical protein
MIEESRCRRSLPAIIVRLGHRSITSTRALGLTLNLYFAPTRRSKRDFATQENWTYDVRWGQKRKCRSLRRLPRTRPVYLNEQTRLAAGRKRLLWVRPKRPMSCLRERIGRSQSRPNHQNRGQISDSRLPQHRARFRTAWAIRRHRGGLLPPT